MPKPSGKKTSSLGTPLTVEDAMRLAGELDTETLVAIVATGATYAEVEQAVLWASGDAEQLGKDAHPLTGAAAAVYDILVADPAFAPEGEP